MKNKICFDFICDESLIFFDVAKKMKKKRGFVYGLKMRNRYPEINDKKIIFYNINDFKRTNFFLTIKKSKHYENKYKINYSDLLNKDRNLRNLRKIDQIRHCNYIIEVVEKLIIKNKVDIFLTTGVAYLYHLVILKLCKIYKKKHFSLYPSRDKKIGYNYSLNNNGSKFNHFNSLFKNKKFIRQNKYKYVKQHYLSYARANPGINFIYIKEFFYRFFQWYFLKWKNNQDYFTNHPFKLLLKYLIKILNRKFINLYNLFLKLFIKQVNNGKFIIYTLQTEPEASTLILSNNNQNQMEVIRNISINLPTEYFLYVKEHPHGYGNNSLFFYKKILKFKNVKLVSPFYNFNDLLKKSDGVVVISGTSGWESYKMLKKTSIIGEIFYSFLPNINIIKNFSQFNNYQNFKKPLLSDALKAQNSYNQSVSDGIFDVHKLELKKIILDPKNLEIFYNSLKKIFKKHDIHIL